MASSEVSEVFTSSFEDERTLNQIATAGENGVVPDPDLYGTEELIVSSEAEIQSSEEIVGSAMLNHDDVYVNSPDADLGDLMIKKEPLTSSTKNRNNTVRGKRKNPLESLFHSSSEDKETTWQQKRVSIKTLEGEFSVTMWASGAEDGKDL